MSYATVADVYRQVPAIASITSITSSTVASFITDIDAIINAKLSARYTVPISPTPPLLNVIGTDLACYRLLRRQFTDDKINKSGWVDRFAEVNSLLAMVCDGSIALTNSAGTQIDTLTGARLWSNHTSYTPTFDVGDPFLQELDEDHQDALDSARD